MIWGWTKLSPTNWCFSPDARWDIRTDWVSGLWHVHKDGYPMHEGFKDAGAAMDAADKLRKAER